jgi:hypothetical protein
MKIAATVVRFQIDGNEQDDSRDAIFAAEVELQKRFGLDPANILVLSAKRDPWRGLSNAWDVEMLLPAKED